MDNIIKFPGNKKNYDDLNQRIVKLKDHIDNLIGQLKATKSTLVEIEIQLNKLKIQNRFQLLKFKKEQDNQ